MMNLRLNRFVIADGNVTYRTVDVSNSRGHRITNTDAVGIETLSSLSHLIVFNVREVRSTSPDGLDLAIHFRRVYWARLC